MQSCCLWRRAVALGRVVLARRAIAARAARERGRKEGTDNEAVVVCVESLEKLISRRVFGRRSHDYDLKNSVRRAALEKLQIDNLSVPCVEHTLL